jgi:hypothetical protein
VERLLPIRPEQRRILGRVRGVQGRERHLADCRPPWRGHNNGRDVFLQTRPSPKGYDLFWHSNDLVYLDRCSRNPNRAECPVGRTGQEAPQPNPPWVVLGHNPSDLHADDTRIVFQAVSPYCIRFISSDGGSQRPAPGDCNGTGAWTYTDEGIRANEIYDFAMTEFTGSADRRGPDLYIATQDNSGYARVRIQKEEP